MLISTLALAALLAQQPAPAQPSVPAQQPAPVQQPAPGSGPQPAAPPLEVATLDAKLGPCSADFTVTDVDGRPVYNATIHVRVRYGALGLKRMDLEVGTNGDGKGRFVGLPDRARPLVYDVTKGETKARAEQDLSQTCKATYELTLKPTP